MCVFCVVLGYFVCKFVGILNCEKTAGGERVTNIGIQLTGGGKVVLIWNSCGPLKNEWDAS